MASKDLYETLILIFPRTDFRKLANLVKDYIIFGPARYKDENWDLFLLTISYEGQDMDFGGLETRIFDRIKKKWITLKADLTTANVMDVYGIKVPVVNREELIAYRGALARDVDLFDIEQLLHRKGKVSSKLVRGPRLGYRWEGHVGFLSSLIRIRSEPQDIQVRTSCRTEQTTSKTGPAACRVETFSRSPVPPVWQRPHPGRRMHWMPP